MRSGRLGTMATSSEYINESYIKDTEMYSSNEDEDYSDEETRQMKAELEKIRAENNQNVTEQKNQITNTENSDGKSSNRAVSYLQYCCCVKSSARFEPYREKSCHQGQRDSHGIICRDVIHLNQHQEKRNKEVGNRSLSNGSFNSTEIDNEVKNNSTEVIKETQRQTKDKEANRHDLPIDYTDFENFLSKIGLDRFFPEKLQLSDVMKIKPKEEVCDSEGIASMFIKNLIMVNFTCRDKMLEEYVHGIPLLGDDTSESNNDLDAILDDPNEENSNIVNPLDLIVAVFKCSSPVLKQVLAAKLFMCQLAVPLVFPAVGNDAMLVSTWPLRSVLINSKTENGLIENIAVDCPCQIVSFIRLGRPTISKSKLINGVLTDQYHDTFLNKDSPLGTTHRVLSNGLVEAAWYIPSNKPSFSSSVCMFLNLRGDCEFFAEQVKLVSSISSVIVITIEIDGLANKDYQQLIIALHKVSTGIILAIDAKKDSSPILKEKLKTYSESNLQFKTQTGYTILSVDGQEKGISSIRNVMRTSINKFLQENINMPLSERLHSCIVEQDENNECFSRTRQMIEGITKLIPTDITSTSIKEQIIPLQGNLWSTWSKHHKDINKASKYRCLNKRGKITNQMTEIRQTQVMIVKQMGSFMHSFINALLRLLPSTNECMVFVLLLKHYFDEKSRCILPKYISKYQSDWQALKSSRNGDDSDIMTILQVELQKSESNLAEASFGFEHLCREMGQIYEALCSSKKTDEKMQELKQQLPMITAKLLILGTPFEIMDGDVANVPLLWVRAVLMKLRDTIGDKKFLALSVLGIQSSGKSTLLNTMFGLQFAVSAGRCTRGVFVQLVPVDDTSLPFDYVLVIDTEGLRAPELGEQKYSHDNELATFVIGLGDITIVNIKGENTAEVKDVLQISVHAFLRLKLANKKLNLTRSCLFVHQNVPAVDANDKMMQGRQKFVENLDKMTKEAADQENIAEIHSFNQVIEFDSEKNVFYFSDLWRGDPPMCPANPGYSDNVSNVRNAIMFDIAAKRSFLTIENTICRIEDLWNGILKDDFVFSFRNTLELKAYNDMDRTCRNLTWELEKSVLEFRRCDAESSLVNCENPNDLDKIISLLMKRLAKKIELKLASMHVELDCFIDNNNLKDVMIQWKQKKHKRFQLLAADLILESKTEIKKTKEEVRFKQIQLSEQTKQQIEINDMARQLALQMQGKPIEETVLKKMFNDKWNTWIDLFLTTEVADVSSIEEQINEMIYDFTPSDATFLAKSKTFNEQYYEIIEKLEDTLPIERITNEHISIHSTLIVYEHDNFESCQRQTLDITNEILKKVDKMLSELNAKNKRFNISYISEIVHLISTDIENHNSCKKERFKFNLLPPFRAMILAHVLPYATIFFKRLDDAYNEKHSPKAQMQAYKGTAWALFKNLVQRNTEDVIALGFFREAVAMAVEEHVSSLIPIDAQDCILNSFSNGKFSLIKDILTHLAEQEDFQNIKAFIKDPHAYAEGWITKLTNAQLFEKKSNGINAFTRLAKTRISKIFSKLSKCITQATRTPTASLSIWIEHFVKLSNDSNCLPFLNATFVHVKDLNVPDLQNFVQMLENQLSDIETVVIDSFKKKSASTFEWKTNLIISIIDKLWGCKEVCMFCKEPCMNTDKNHIIDGYSHKCLQHRPEGIGGMRWESSGNLEEKFCNHSINTDNTYENVRGKTGKYSEYKANFPDWDIAPNSDVSYYWIWIFVKFQEELKEMHNAKLPIFPDNWACISKSEAIDSLR